MEWTISERKAWSKGKNAYGLGTQATAIAGREGEL
jgi:hypothetical protein